ncbi:hypothetical protein [Myxococcus stipitatus]|uniref:hypothetical protein n=1 Tax=Myxococcus stipitatus TaxID=83455 RepID=UPI0030D5BEEA
MEDAPQSLSPLEQLDARQQSGTEEYTATAPSESTGVTTPQGTQTTPQFSDETQGTGQQPTATAPTTSGQDPTQWGTGTSGTFTQPGVQSPVVMLPYPYTNSTQESGSTTSETQTTQGNTEQEFVGEVVKASEDEVLLGQSGEAQLQLTVDPKTQVTLNGFNSVAEDIQEGTQVRASYTTDSAGQGRAVRIDATTQGDTSGTQTSPQQTQPSQ